MERLQQFATRVLAIIIFKGGVHCKPLWGQGDFRLVAGERAQLSAKACLVDVVPQICRHTMLAQVTGKDKSWLVSMIYIDHNTQELTLNGRLR